MKVLAITNLFPTAAQPTRGVFNRHRLGALASRCDLRLICPLPGWSRARAGRTVGTVLPDYPVFPTQYWSLPGVPVLHARGMAASLMPLVRRLHSEAGIDVLLGIWGYPDLAAASMIARRLRVPMVGMVLGSDVNHLTRFPSLRNQIVQGMADCHAVVAVSSALGDRLRDLGVEAGRVVVRHNCVDGEVFRIRDRAEARSLLGLPLHGQLIGYIGNLVPEKGGPTLVEAFRRLREGREDVRLVLVGSGPLEASLQQEIAEAGLGAHVTLVGNRPHSEVPLWHSAIDVLCLPSFREGCPNVVLEALASGKPVVASEVGGVPELLTPSTGRMVPAGNPVALAAALEDALAANWDQEELRRSVGCLSWDVFGERLFDTLTAAVAEGPLRRENGTPIRA